MSGGGMTVTFLLKSARTWIVMHCVVANKKKYPSYIDSVMLFDALFQQYSPPSWLFLSARTRFVERDEFFNRSLIVIFTRKPNICNKLALLRASRVDTLLRFKWKCGIHFRRLVDLTLYNTIFLAFLRFITWTNVKIHKLSNLFLFDLYSSHTWIHSFIHTGLPLLNSYPDRNIYGVRFESCERDQCHCDRLSSCFGARGPSNWAEPAIVLGVQRILGQLRGE